MLPPFSSAMCTGCTTTGDTMSRLFLAGFVLVSAAAAGAVDYVNQARRAGSQPGAFALTSYLDTLSGRFTGGPAPAGNGGTAEAATRGAGTPKPEVRVNDLGSNCTIAGGIKRCSLGGG